MLKRIVQSIPNTITLLNLLSGLTAIIFSFHASETIGCMTGYQWVAVCIGAAAVFDFCDGAAARLLAAYSALGKELDSLADLVSFGVAPSMLLLNAMLDLTGGNALSYISLFIPLMGALRLAKFNIDDTQSTTFSGLPIPANAIFWIGFVSCLYSLETMMPAWIVSVITVAVSLLMVADMRMFSLKFKNFHFKENVYRFVIIAIAVISVSLCGITGLMWTIAAYVALSAVAGRKA